MPRSPTATPCSGSSTSTGGTTWCTSRPGSPALALARSFSGARTYAGALGAVYAGLAILGLALGDGESIVGILPINTEDNVLHVLLSTAGLAAYFASTSEPAPSTV